MTTATQEKVESKKDWKLGVAANVVMKMIGFEPTGEEQARILRCRKRFKQIVGGERAGKSKLAAADLSIHILEDMAKHPGEMLLYWLVAADYERTRAEFGYIVEYLEKLTMPGISKVESSKRVDPGLIELQYKGEVKPRIRIETKSGKDPRTLAMFAPHGIVGCEASQLDLETYFKCCARLTEKRGWFFLSGTLEGSLGWYPGLQKAWTHGNKDEQSFILPATSNRILYPLGENDPEIQRLKSNSSDAFFMERIMGMAAPPKGIVFTEFRPDVHIREVEYNPDLPIYIWEDPGYGHAHAIEIAQVAQGGQVRVVDEIYEQGIITEDLIQACIMRRWWKNPNKTLVIEPNYATQHHGTHSIAEIWAAPPARLTAMGTKIKISEGTERLKSFLKVNPLTGEPGIVFSPKCKGILSEVGAYPNPFDGQTKVYSWKVDREGNVVGDEPDDKWNDGCKAVIYGLVEQFGLSHTGASEFFTMKRYGVEHMKRVPSHFKQVGRYARI